VQRQRLEGSTGVVARKKRFHSSNIDALSLERVHIPPANTAFMVTQGIVAYNSPCRGCLHLSPDPPSLDLGKPRGGRRRVANPGARSGGAASEGGALQRSW
jgi:hypothetical protein